MRWEATSPAPSLAQTVGPVGAPPGGWQLNSTVSPLPKATCSCWLGSGPGTSVEEMVNYETSSPKQHAVGPALYFANTSKGCM